MLIQMSPAAVKNLSVRMPRKTSNCILSLIFKHITHAVTCQEVLHDGLAGASSDCFLLNICSEKQTLPRIVYCLRAAKNFLRTVPYMYTAVILRSTYI